MEAWQMDHIRRNLPDLLTMTKCSVVFLSHFRADGLVSEEEVDILGQMRNMREQAMEFYNIIQTRCRSFNLLKQALAETSQTGAFTILEKCPQEEKAKLQYHGAIGYDKTELLGRGCFGTKVFLGKYGSRDVAVKKIHIDEVAGDMAKEEVKFLKKLDWHENVVRLFEMVETDDFILIALELCDNDLHNWVMKPNTVDRIVKAELEIIAQSARGIGHLHKNRVVHRDLKPANILMVRQATGDIRVKISDFGMAKKMLDGESRMSVHSSGVGTEGWMAPEVIRTQFNVDGSSTSVTKMGFPSDIFSLGCIFYFVLTGGVHPFGDPLVRQGKIYKGKSKLKVEQLKTPSYLDNPGVIRLISLMIAKEETDRPSIFKVIESLAELEDPLNKNDITTFNETKEPVHQPLTDLNINISDNKKSLTDPGPSQPPPQNTKREFQDPSGNTQLHRACSAKNEDLVKDLVRKGADVNVQNKSGESPLHSTAKYMHRTNTEIDTSWNILKYLIDTGGDVFLQREDGFTFLHQFLKEIAIWGNSPPTLFTDVAEYLVEKGYSELFNVSGGDAGETPFHSVVKYSEIHETTLATLQKNGVDFNASDELGNSTLFYALAVDGHRRSEDFLSSLIRFGADVRHLSKDNRSLLHHAAYHANLYGINLFLGLGLDVNGLDEGGCTPTHLAMTSMKYNMDGSLICKITAELIEAGANLNIRDKNGDTPMDMLSKMTGLSDWVKAKVSKMLQPAPVK